MIKKIKELMRTKEMVDDVKDKIKDNKKEVNELKKEITELRKAIEASQKQQDDFSENLNKNIGMIDELKDDFKKELYDFKLLKSQLHKKLVEKFQEELDRELKENVEKIQVNTKDYEEVQQKIDSAVLKLDSFNHEISKLTEISKNLKKEDFELTKFANQLKEADKEKLNLMRRIDTLERLISKMRRGG